MTQLPESNDGHPAMVRARQQPQASPHVLHRLAEGDRAVYLAAMIEAGHLVPKAGVGVVVESDGDLLRIIDRETRR